MVYVHCNRRATTYVHCKVRDMAYVHLAGHTSFFSLTYNVHKPYPSYYSAQIGGIWLMYIISEGYGLCAL